MKTTHEMRDLQRFSTLMAMLALILATHYGVDPARVGLLSTIIIDMSSSGILPVLLVLFGMLVTGAGCIWLFIPFAQGKNLAYRLGDIIPNLILPVISFPVFSVLLFGMARNYLWWLVFATAVLLLGLLIWSEMHILSEETVRNPLYSIAIIGLANALFLILSISNRASNARFYIMMPMIGLAAFFTALRMLYLRCESEWYYEWALVIGLIIGQLAGGLYYLFINPLQFGLVLVCGLYVLSSLTIGLLQNKKGSSLWLEPVSFTIILIAVILKISF